MKWPEFWNVFEVTIDQNSNLSNIEKFIYLKNSLTGDAKQALSGILISNENYKNAKTLLKEIFEDIELLKRTHFAGLINLPKAANTTRDLRAIYNKIECHLRNLESLKQDINHDIFVSIISSKIPKEVLLQLVLKRGATEKWTASTLRKAFKNYVVAAEWVEEVSTPDMPKVNRQTHRNGSYHRFFQQCKFCNGDHWSDQCVEYTTAEDRKLKIKDSCFLCLQQGHIAHKCRLNKVCYYCKCINHHHRSLCPQEFRVKSTNGAEGAKKENCQPNDSTKNENNEAETICQNMEQVQNGKTDTENDTVQHNESRIDNKPAVEHLKEHDSFTNVVYEETLDRKQFDIDSAMNKLMTENAELQAMNAELRHRLIDI